MTVTEVAVALDCGKAAVRKAIVRGTLAATLQPGKFGDEYHVTREEMERYKAAHRTPRKAAR